MPSHLIPVTAGVSSDGYLTMSYRINTTAPDVTLIPEATSSLTSGSWSSTGLVEISRVNNGDHYNVTVRDSQLMSAGGARFMRLRVTRP